MKRFAWSLAPVVIALLAPGPVGASTHQCMPLPSAKIGAQSYSFASRILEPSSSSTAATSGTSPTRLGDSFLTLRAAGFRQIESFGGVLGLSTDAYRQVSRTTGIATVAGHYSLEPATWDAALSEAKALGMQYIGSGGFGPPGFRSLDDTLATAANLDRLGRAAAAKGMKLYVHNHDGEFSTRYPYDLGNTGQLRSIPVWEIIAANTDPRYVFFEVDIYWARRGLGVNRFEDLLTLLRRYRRRLAMLHVKDTAPDGAITDLGRGTTDWRAIFKAAGTGIRYYFWEYDAAPDPARSAAIAWRYLRCMK